MIFNIVEKSAVHQITSHMAIHKEKMITAPSSHLSAHGYICKKSLRYPRVIEYCVISELAYT